jgi:hypothetical protein
MELLLNQGGSILRPLITEQPMKGTGSQVVDQVGKSTTHDMPARGSRTLQHSTPLTSRWAHPKGKYTTETVATPDLMKTLADPTNKFLQSMANAVGEDVDREIIRAVIGTSMIGPEGTTSLALPATQIMPHGSTGMTVAKLMKIRTKFKKADVDMKKDPVTIVLSPDQMEDLFKAVEIGSADYNPIRSLYYGEVDMFLGMRFVESNLLPKSGTTRTCVAFSASAITLGIWEGIFGRVTELPEQHYERLLYIRKHYGATRTEELKVQSIGCTEAA